MKAFAQLYQRLDSTNRTNDKVTLLRDFFSLADARDAAWVLYFLLGSRRKRAVTHRNLLTWASEVAGVSPWLFDECYSAVGDSAETIALLLPEGTINDASPLYEWVEERLLPLSKMEEDQQRQQLLDAWQRLDRPGQFVWNKLITGAFRVGVAKTLIVRAICQAFSLDPTELSARLMHDIEPSAQWWKGLISADRRDTLTSPVPFCLAHALDVSLTDLGNPIDWQIEWKWDGIRSQLIRHGSVVHLWSRGEELITEQFPEITQAATRLPQHVLLDGEILAWNEQGVMPFSALQKRLGRKSITRSILKSSPVVFMAYDLLRLGEDDFRSQSQSVRRRVLEQAVVENDVFKISPLVSVDSWDQTDALLASARSRGVEGLMLKKQSSSYQAGRVKGEWWKLKVQPLTIDAVLVMAQRGSGKRASLYTDYTFALWDDGQLTPIAKAYSGLTDDQIKVVDRFVREHTQDKFGPVRRVEPLLVFELGFEAVAESSRHRSGVAVRFPRILRQRTDKKPEQADQLSTLKAMIPRAMIKSEPPGLFDGM
jgi:DNA ligase 1